MNEILLVLLSLSVSGSILALLLFALRPMIKTRLSQTWQYYIWLVVILRFLLPFSPEISVVGEAARHIENSIAAPVVTVPANEPASGGEDQPFATAPQEEAETAARPVWRNIADNIWMLWFIVALAIFTYRIIVYNNFTRYVRGRAQVITEARLQDIYQNERKAANIRRKLPLRVSDRVGTPMLIGILRPMLVLPILEAGDEELRQIFRHELTHYKRLDYLYKWIVQFTICLHWFNPLVYRIGRQIDKSCELSCDEAVIRNMDSEGRVTYGRALMASLKSQENYSSFVISMTMSDNAKSLKERLDTIMTYSKKPKSAVICMAVLTIALIFGAGAMGAYAQSPIMSNNTPNAQTTTLNATTIKLSHDSPITELDVRATVGNLVVQYGENVEISIGEKLVNHASYSLNEGKFVYRDDFDKNNLSFPDWNYDDYKIIITIPKSNPTLDNLFVDVSVGTVDLKHLIALDAKVSGTTNIDLSMMSAENLEVTGQIAELSAERISVPDKLTLDLAGGNAVISGYSFGDVQVDVSMIGTVSLTLLDKARTDYSISTKNIQDMPKDAADLIIKPGFMIDGERFEYGYTDNNTNAANSITINSDNFGPVEDVSIQFNK